MTAEQWHLDRCGSAVVDGQTVPACHLSEETTHDPRVELTEAERDRLAGIIRWHGRCHAEEPDGNYLSLAVENVELYVERIIAERIAARLAPIRALVDDWERQHSHLGIERGHYGPSSRALRAALDALSAPVSAEQGHDGVGGQGEGERALRQAAAAARGMHDPPAPDCAEWADWLDRRADNERTGR